MEQLGQEDPKSMQRLLWATLLMALIFGAWALFIQPQRQHSAEQAGRASAAPAKAAGSTPQAPAPGGGPRR